MLEVLSKNPELTSFPLGNHNGNIPSLELEIPGLEVLKQVFNADPGRPFTGVLE
jgi:hypothetical protein